jgi:CheY-like chemotaxis protein
LESFFDFDVAITHVDSVRDAVMEVGAQTYSLIVLDMALPTFSTSTGSSADGLDQALGGVEVLRALKSKSIKASVIIITQHPHITVGGKTLKLGDAAPLLSARYDQHIVGSFIYKYKSPSNQSKLVSLLRKMQ